MRPGDRRDPCSGARLNLPSCCGASFDELRVCEFDLKFRVRSLEVGNSQWKGVTFADPQLNAAARKLKATDCFRLGCSPEDAAFGPAYVFIRHGRHIPQE